jgi:hypothetical protein
MAIRARERDSVFFHFGPDRRNAHMVFEFSCEVVGLRDHLEDAAEIEFQFNSPMAAVVHLSKKYSDGREPDDPSSVVCVGTTAGEIEDDTCADEIRAALSSPPPGDGQTSRELTPAKSLPC